MRITKNKIVAADDDFGNFSFGSDSQNEEDEELSDTIDDMSDAVEDLQDTVNDIQEDDPDIEINNNIDGKYIAECDKCHGVFISAVSESDQYVESIIGTCPLCDHDTEQYLKWVIKKVE